MSDAGSIRSSQRAVYSIRDRWKVRAFSTVVRILVVDDYDRFRAFVCSLLGQNSKLLIVGEASDGLQGVQKAQELRPDLVLLDIGLPRLNGIQAALEIQEVSPNSKILFLSENRSRDIAQECLG